MLFNSMLFKLKKIPLYFIFQFVHYSIKTRHLDFIFHTQTCKRIEATRDVVLSTFNYYY